MSLSKTWQFKTQKTKIEKQLAQDLGVSQILAQLLVNRGFEEAREAECFLKDDLTDLTNPDVIPGITEAIVRINQALDRREKIVIYGDYDVDGLTSTVLLLETLMILGLDADYYIPQRIAEGYGLNLKALGKLASREVDLILTVDCGIASCEEIKKGQELGLDFIVTDHHLPPKQLPSCLIVNPAVETGDAPWKKLAGVGVAFKLAQALLEDRFGAVVGRQKAFQFLDLVALGTIADMVPLRAENRIFAKYGLREMSRGHRLGLKKLAQISKIDLTNISAEQIAFGLAPRINACGRIGNPALAVQLLMSQDAQEAEKIAEQLNQTNQNRQNMEAEITQEAIAMVEKQNLHQHPCIILASPNWHPGLIGIAAAKIVDKYYRPTILFTLNNGFLQGSGRSIQDFHLYEALAQCEDLLDSFGGHSQAVGVTISRNKYRDFCLRFGQVAEQALEPEDLIPTIILDGEVNLENIDFDTWEEISQLEPFGLSNPEPVLAHRGGKIKYSRLVGHTKEHLRMRIKAGNSYWNGIGFNLASYQKIADTLAPMDLAFVLNKNTWLGRTELQLVLKDLRPANV